ncbi:type II secretion system protein [Andreprevotia chitinilytica]|uniref:type II secretion system protein n=1 Tax=Andreprevotia chitinilytica TaxID=396808 RepID=UPI001FE07602|nr:prepilin-type N-terminal cleavage/methylation domain-containing protein [Andreprevotia chitinilytica]
MLTSPQSRMKWCGFSLIELMVVLVIVGLLLSIAVPRYFSALDRSKDTALREDLRVMRSVLSKFYSDRGQYPQSLQELIDTKYLKDIPIDPITETADSWVTVASKEEGVEGIADIKSGATGNTVDGVPYESL